jgi:hypothetical protein
MQKAVDNYKLASEKLTETHAASLLLDFRVAAYGPDKLAVRRKLNLSCSE